MTHSNRAYSKYLKLFWITGIIVIFDQLTKAVVMDFLPLYQSKPVIAGFFSITHIHNPGGAFGFLASQGPILRLLVFFLAAVLAMGVVFYLYGKTYKTHPLLNTSLAFIFGGAAGNLIDRIRFGRVVDFLDFYIGNFHWPAFNIADSAISIGIVIFLYHVIFNKMPG
ncbi:MAG: signal peptidase II [Desulfobacterales bacterium]|nr:signal peptidase II [Desulfobacterales bacterium]MDD4071148.1 signal peptidase II [Desulfobacterales bacterium]MDD4392584.1 signal peptidase II [Desulfobacterales bacterium]